MNRFVGGSDPGAYPSRKGKRGRTARCVANASPWEAAFRCTLELRLSRRAMPQAHSSPFHAELPSRLIRFVIQEGHRPLNSRLRLLGYAGGFVEHTRDSGDRDPCDPRDIPNRMNIPTHSQRLSPYRVHPSTRVIVEV